MITYEEAKKLIEKAAKSLPVQEILLEDSLGCVVAEDIISPISLPSFDNSAMDGYAFKSSDTVKARPGKPVYLRIVCTIKAGQPNTGTGIPAPGAASGMTAYKIMTGALMPKGADTVIPQEIALAKNGFLVFNNFFGRGRNVRYEGEELKKGQQVLAKGAAINPGTIGFLASLGKSRVRVFGKPRVSLVATGSELVEPGRPLSPGKIYDSNSFMIAAALSKMAIQPALVKTVPDKPKVLRGVIAGALQKSDILILMGGVSTGDYDYVKPLLQELGVSEIFWKVSQKPGKPVYFGKKNSTLVFGLPGNPASVFVCFYEYVYPALRRMMGFANSGLPSAMLPLQNRVRADQSKLLFLKGKVAVTKKGRRVIPLPHQGSHMLSSLCDTDGFILIPPRKTVFQTGERVPVHLL